MGLAVALLMVSPVQASQTPAWEDLTSSLELAHRYPGSMVPVWFDVNQDGQRDPIWLSYDGVEALVFNEDGVPSLVSVEMPKKFQVEEGPELLGAPIDADGDGDEELLVLGFEAGLLEVTAPYKLSLAQSSLPTLPGASVGDIAVGDLNADGRPDVVIGFGVFALERIERRGFPDRVLMNLGEGRFEWHDIEPSADVFTHGLTLVDMDDDGRLDIVESFNSSQLTRLARVLLNRTSPGSIKPVFITGTYAHDIGSNGMGAAVADINEDGFMDVYNTTVGLDYLCIGTDESACQDQTIERGLRIEWGSESIRQQWAPTFADINADGLLDLVVRHGGVGTSADSGLGWSLSYSEPDLVYVQDESGIFRRTETPFEPLLAPNGRQMVLGDLDQDGLPDLALGGELGSAGFWRNATEVTGRRPLTLRIRGTISGQPAIGTKVVSSCDGRSLSRQLTSGGKMGGTQEPALFLAFPDCKSEATLDVRWPSGSRTTHSVGLDQRTLEIVEPVWHALSEESPGSVVLNPALVGAQEACMGTESSSWDCCALVDAPCTFPVSISASETLIARLDDHPAQALPYGASRWVIASEPSPPRVGEPVIWRLHHVGDPAKMDPTVSLFVDGTVAGWQDLEAGPSTLSAVTDVPLDAKTIDLSLFPMDIPPSVTWTMETASVLDAGNQILDAYTYRIIGGVTEHWQGEVFTTFLRGVALSTIFENAVLQTPDGQVLDMAKNVIPAGVARMRLMVEWDKVEGYDSLHLVDLQGSADRVLPLPKPLTLAEAAATVDHVRGGIAKNRFVTGGDLGSVIFTLHDKSGAVMPPEPELVTIEVDGGYTMQELGSFAGTYNLFIILVSDDEPGVGEVRVRSTDGRLLGSFPFYKRVNGDTGVDLEATTASLDLALESESPATHSVKLFPVNDYDEFTGPGTIVDLAIQGGDQLSLPEMIAGGGLECLIEADPMAEELSIDVTLDGVFFTTLQADLTPAQVVDEAPIAEGDVQGGDTAEPAPPAPSSKGCGGCGASPGSSGDLWLIMASLLALWPRRRVS